MTPDEFAAEFDHVITVCLNWRRFFAERWPVSAHQLHDRTDLNKCFIPWYLDGTGQFIQNATPADPPLQVCSVLSRLATLPDKQKNGIEQYAQQFRAMTGPIAFRLPAYALPRGRFLALDGNHRLSALTLVDQPFSVTLCSIDGPVEGNCLFDLRYWQANPEA